MMSMMMTKEKNEHYQLSFLKCLKFKVRVELYDDDESWEYDE